MPTPLRIKERGDEDGSFVPCRAEIDFGSSFVSYKCGLGLGHDGPHQHVGDGAQAGMNGIWVTLNQFRITWSR